MGVLNAIFAPFIVLYLVMYSFFRYFEVCEEHPLLPNSIVTVAVGVRRNITRIHPILAEGDIRHSHSGSFASLMNCHTSSSDV